MAMAELDGGNLLEDIYNQFLVCKICYEPYRQPKTLSCMHVFCFDCLEKHQDAELERSYRYMLYSRAISCPICRKKTELPPGGVCRLQDSFLVSNLKEVITRKKPEIELTMCEICSFTSNSEVDDKQKEAVSKCLECCKLLCFSCVRSHKNTNVTKGHSLYDIGVEKDIECKTHEGELIRYYCEECEACICVLCTFQLHKDHVVTSFSEGIHKYQSSMELLVDQCKERITDIQDQLNVINKCEYELKNTEEQIKDQSIEAMATVRRLQCEMLNNLHRAYGDEALAYLKRKVFLQDALETLLGACKLTDVVMNDRSIEILLLKKQLQNKLEISLQTKYYEPPSSIFKEIRFNPHPPTFGYLHIDGNNKLESEMIDVKCLNSPYSSEDEDKNENKQSHIVNGTDSCTDKYMDDTRPGATEWSKQNGLSTESQSCKTQATNTTPWHELLADIMASQIPTHSLSVPEQRLATTTSSGTGMDNYFTESSTSSNGMNNSRSFSSTLSSSSDSSYSLNQFTNTSPTITCDRTTITIQKTIREQCTDTIDLKDLTNKTTSTEIIQVANCGTTTDGVEQVNRSTHTPLPEMSDKITSTKKIIKTDQQTMTPLAPIMLDIGLNSIITGEDKSVGTKTIVHSDAMVGDNYAEQVDQETETAWNGMIVKTCDQSSSTRVIVFSRSTSPETENTNKEDDNLSALIANSLSDISEVDTDDESAFTYHSDYTSDADTYFDDSDLYESTLSLSMRTELCRRCQQTLDMPLENKSRSPTPISEAVQTNICKSGIASVNTETMTEMEPVTNDNHQAQSSVVNGTSVSCGTEATYNQDILKTDVADPATKTNTLITCERRQLVEVGTETISTNTKECGNNTEHIEQHNKEINVSPITRDEGTNMPVKMKRHVCVDVRPHTRTRGLSPVRVPGIDISTLTQPIKMASKYCETTRLLLHDMASDSIAMRGDDKEVSASVEMVDVMLDAYRLESKDQSVGTTAPKKYNSGTSMTPVLYSSKETLTSRIHTMNKNTSTDNAVMVHKQTSTVTNDITAAYRVSAEQNGPKRTITRGTTMTTPQYTERETSPIKQLSVLTDRASSPVKIYSRDRATNVDKADLMSEEKYYNVGTGDDQTIKRAPSLDTIREDSKESSLDLEDEDDFDPFSNQPASSVALSSAISTILTHIESFCATSYTKDDTCQSTFSHSMNNKPNVSPILCRVEQGTSTHSVEMQDKAISTEAVSVDGKMAECITKLKTLSQRLEQPSVTSTGTGAFCPLYSKADTSTQATTIASSSTPISTSRTKSSETTGSKPEQLKLPFVSPPLHRKQLTIPAKSPLSSPRSKARKQRLDMSHLLCTDAPPTDEFTERRTKSCFPTPLHVKVHHLPKLNLNALPMHKSPRLGRNTKQSRMPTTNSIYRSSSEETLPKTIRAKLTRAAISLDEPEVHTDSGGSGSIPTLTEEEEI